MYRLKLVKGKTYWGAGVKASQEKPYVEVETKEQAERLVKSGHFMLEVFEKETNKEENAAENDEELSFPEDEVEEENTGNSILAELQTKKKDELVQYAADCGIDIVGCKTKDDIISKIVEALARAAVARDAIRGEE